VQIDYQENPQAVEKAGRVRARDPEQVAPERRGGARSTQIVDHNAEPLAALVTRFQHELRQEALTLGAKLYEEKPSAFTHRFAEYWKEWRH
jgi:hypothetical protein